jgi:hypothetical protein
MARLRIASSGLGRNGGGAAGSGREHGFTLVELSTSVGVLLVVLTAAWLLLSASNDNLNRIDNGSQASEASRAAFASFERDLGHSRLTSLNASPILTASPTKCEFLADTTGKNAQPQLVTWFVDDTSNTLVRVVRKAPTIPGHPDQLQDSSWFTKAAQFNGGAAETSTVLAGMALTSDLPSGKPVFSYQVSATIEDFKNDPGRIGLVILHIRNGLPTGSQNIIDRTSAFRVLAYVINGYQ